MKTQEPVKEVREEETENTMKNSLLKVLFQSSERVHQYQFDWLKSDLNLIKVENQNAPTKTKQLLVNL